MRSGGDEVPGKITVRNYTTLTDYAALLRAGIVYFTTTRKYVPYIRKIAGKEDYADVRNVMIMGGSRIASKSKYLKIPEYQRPVIQPDCKC